MVFTSFQNLLPNLEEQYHRFKRRNSRKYAMAKRKNKQNANSGLWVLVVVALIAVGGLWLTSEEAPAPVVLAPEPVMLEPEPQVDPARLAAMKGCQENYDYTFALCNRRTHQASVDNCLGNADEILDDCLAKI